MPQYLIEVRQTNTLKVTITANSKLEAKQIVEDNYSYHDFDNIWYGDIEVYYPDIIEIVE